MPLVRVGRNSALRVAFLTDSRFERENAASGGKLKQRALRCIMRQVRYPVIENSDRPDAVFYIQRLEGSKGWKLVKRQER